MQWPSFENSDEWCLLGRQLRRFLDADRRNASKFNTQDFTWMDKWCPSSGYSPNEVWFGEGWFRSDTIFYRDLHAWRAEMTRYDERELQAVRTAQHLFLEIPHSYGAQSSASGYQQCHTQSGSGSHYSPDAPDVFMRRWPLQNGIDRVALEGYPITTLSHPIDSSPEPGFPLHHFRISHNSFDRSAREMRSTVNILAESSALTTLSLTRGRRTLPLSQDRSVSPEIGADSRSHRWNDYRQREHLVSSRHGSNDMSLVQTSRGGDNAMLKHNTADDSDVKDSQCEGEEASSAYHREIIRSHLQSKLQRQLAQFRFEHRTNGGSQKDVPTEGLMVARRYMD
ncbi:hypothetical protein G7Z17_g2634 [Cylindrodendrum hubeiense]|uniref:Uncharacterized protein n=1 Tax=Cylindrodendrum hubeiense TaxID=595255 RepID=A0A9P5HH98_9HYPO|nr:hypothetical protein G7Z17_g2634 [Cylindrodendrum hubeiense]